MSDVEKNDPAHECHLCKKQTNALAGDPSRWPVLLPYPGGNGNMREYHVGCVAKVLASAEDHAAALAAERAKFAAFAGPDGEPMPVLGVLPVTADHRIVGMNGEDTSTTVYIPRVWNDGTRSVIAKQFCSFLPSVNPLSSFYSTKEAATSALDAAKEKPNG